MAQLVKVSDRTVRRWVTDFETLEYVFKSERGKHSKVDSPIMTNLEFREKFKAHVREASRPKGNLHQYLHNRGASTSTSREQYFHIRGAVLSHPGSSTFTSKD